MERSVGKMDFQKKVLTSWSQICVAVGCLVLVQGTERGILQDRFFHVHLAGVHWALLSVRLRGGRLTSLALAAQRTGPVLFPVLFREISCSLESVVGM